MADGWNEAFPRLLGELYRKGARDQEFRGIEPCPYCCNGQRTGLPGNACENCMNTGLADPTAVAP